MARRRGKGRRKTTWILTIGLVTLISLETGLATTVIGLLKRMMISPSSCSVARVVDGDTLDMSCQGKDEERVRIIGIDAPEISKPGCVSEAVAGYRAKVALQWLVWRAKDVTARFDGRDKYDRTLAEVYLDGQSLAQTVIASGHARAYDGGLRQGWC